MRTTSHTIVISLVTILFMGQTYAKTGPADLPDKPDRTLLSLTNPLLADVNNLCVVVTLRPLSADPNQVQAGQLRQNIETELRKSGINITDEVNLPEFRLDIDVLNLSDANQYVFYVQASVAKNASLDNSHNTFIKADVWESEPVMRAVESKDLSGTLSAVVLEQAQTFVSAWSVARAIKTSETKPAVKNAVEQKFVASKNSQVFHKPDCPSAQRISAKNLIVYGSREEAVNAGKRPCSRCNP